MPTCALVALVCALLTFDAAAECPAAEAGAGTIDSAVIRVATLNIAHGRKDGRNQMLLGEETIRSNLVEVADFLDRSEADVIALQEVLRIIETHKDSHRIVIGIDSLGKEEVLVAVAQQFKAKLRVTTERVIKAENVIFGLKLFKSGISGIFGGLNSNCTRNGKCSFFHNFGSTLFLEFESLNCLFCDINFLICKCQILICNVSSSQCGNLKILVSLRFYVKSILRIL